MSSTAKKGLVAGAFSLALAGLLSKILGVVYILPFQNMAGDYVLALYQHAYAIYVVILTVTTAGIPLAISKLIAERNTMRDYAMADQIYRVGARYMTIAGVIMWLVMFALGGVIAIFVGNYAASTAIRALSFALLVVPLLAAMRGYLQGHQEMAISGYSQVLEQLVRVLVILVGVYTAVTIEASSNWTAAIATFSGVLGAACSVVYLARHVVRVRRENKQKITRESGLTNKQVFRKIALIALPISLSSLVLPLSQNVDNFTITNLLKWGLDMSQTMADSEFGIFTGRALRLIAMPLSLATAIGLSLMPAITQAIAEKNTQLRNERVLMSYRLTSFFSFPMAAGILLLAGPIDIMMFKDTAGADTIAMVSLMAIFSSFELVTAYVLQALGHMYLPIRYMFAGLGLKLVLNFALVPFYGIFGAAVASVAGYLLSSILNFRSVQKIGGIPLAFNDIFGKPVLASIVMGIVVWIITKIPFELIIPYERFANLALVLVSGAVGAAVFFAVMVLIKGITREEMKRMPVVKKFVR
ncbi:putative polysaccharide biosynthesis protein [Tumebacillus permanentifrigoris]|uniref:PST family polysaccharide transporter/stage V sporulation protein B n=1 Tax=Tumebacillus permanentifrigoris TaxID=378543 RepID=A0A316D5X1_9BACL|nr:polysaccharide biosynthesis protein [Tumebacillus permanentifrigoris]PWK09061.1 PST family polysaccharide transporter/stage V sporulation protein B [Tumebacillus permanentifrigoris]